LPTKHQGSSEEQLALNAYIKLMRAAESVTARLNRQLALQQLTMSQFGALEALYHIGPLNQTELGRKLLKSGGNITTVVDNLEMRGLAQRQRSKEDRRVIIVTLTTEGRRLIRRIFPRHVERIVKEFSVLSAAELLELGELCRRLGLQLPG
jgi:MarR family 2-MHQ and catechol resistance regulon transcriptional repressor